MKKQKEQKEKKQKEKKKGGCLKTFLKAFGVVIVLFIGISIIGGNSNNKTDDKSKAKTESVAVSSDEKTADDTAQADTKEAAQDIQTEDKENEEQQVEEQADNSQASAPEESVQEEPTADEQEATTEPSATDETDSNEITVYITDTGSKYHTGTCRTLKDSKIPISLSEAVVNYEPCGICHPPRLN